MPIRSLDELIHYSEKLAAESPLIADRVLITKASNLAEAKKLREHFPTISNKLTKTLERVCFDQISIGYCDFNIHNGHGYIDSLLWANQPTNRLPALAKLPNNCFYLAHIDGDPVVVNPRGEEETRDAIAILRHDSFASPIRLAPDFESFLLLAANLDEIGQREELEYEAQLQALSEIVVALLRDRSAEMDIHLAEYARGWKLLGQSSFC